MARLSTSNPQQIASYGVLASSRSRSDDHSLSDASFAILPRVAELAYTTAERLIDRYRRYNDSLAGDRSSSGKCAVILHGMMDELGSFILTAHASMYTPTASCMCIGLNAIGLNCKNPVSGNIL